MPDFICRMRGISMTVITHNLAAMNTDRQLGIVSENKKKSAEKLSSGYKINRSADDAAGLQISEKMRKQVKGLNKASNNIQDGMSMIQTADGALAEVHDTLQRMNELALHRRRMIRIRMRTERRFIRN